MISAVLPTGRGPNVTREMLEEIGIEATEAEVNALNLHLESRARNRVEGGGTIVISLKRDNVDHAKIERWAEAVEDALTYWIATGRFTLAPGEGADEEQAEAVRRHTRDLVAGSSG